MRRKRLLAVMVFCLLGSVAPVRSQTAGELWAASLSEYLDCLQRDESDKGLGAMSVCAAQAQRADLDPAVKLLTWYLYLAELLRHDPQNADVARYSGRICNQGSKLDREPLSYGLDLLTADAYLVRSAHVTPAWRPVLLVKAQYLLQRLGKRRIEPKAEPEYETFYALAGLTVSNDSRLRMLEIVSRLQGAVSGKEWYDAARTAYDALEGDGNRHVALVCVQRSEEMGCADAWALHGCMYETGDLLRPDLAKAVRYYGKAADGGSVWGRVRYAGLLIDGLQVRPDDARALRLLTSVEEDPDFLRLGGGYYLAMLYEEGRGVASDTERALELYTDSFERCIWTALKEASYEGSKRMEDRLVRELLDRELADADPERMSGEELASAARRYEAVGALAEASVWLARAARKGYPRAAEHLEVLEKRLQHEGE